MEPLRETTEALRALDRFGDTHVAEELSRIGRDVLRVVPDLMGVSIGLVTEGLTFTLVASSDLALELDVPQYLDDGPCVRAMSTGEAVATHVESLLDEDQWRLFARAASSFGIESTLSLPVLHEGSVIAGVNLYASSSDAFEGRHEILADICRAWAPGAVTNADLSFRSRLEAKRTPQRMRDRVVVDQATGMLAEASCIATDEAASRIEQAAARAGISEAQAAHTVILVLSSS